MSLLSAQQLLQIRTAIKSVTDTFAVTPITLHQLTVVDDIYNEDNNVYSEAVNFEVGALVEYDEVTDAMKETLEGSFDYNESKLTLNVDDMIEAGVVVPVSGGTYTCVLETERDYFTLKGKMYRITDILFDGPLEPKEILLVIRGVISQTRITLP